MDHNAIQSLLIDLEKERQIINKALRKLPRGTLRIWRNGGGRIMRFREYYYEKEKKLKSLGREDPLVYALAHKKYLTEKLRRIEENIRVIQKSGRRLLSLDPADILASLPAHYDLLDPVRVIDPDSFRPKDYPNPVFDKSILPRPAALKLIGQSAEEWARTPYAANTINLHLKIHTTSRGILCRSKNEVLLLEGYDALGIPYHYDEVVLLEDRYVSPDTIFPSRSGRLIYHEHAGLRTDGYLADMKDKLQAYISCSIIPGDNLIVTFDHDDGGINMELIMQLIKDKYNS